MNSKYHGCEKLTKTKAYFHSTNLCLRFCWVWNVGCYLCLNDTTS